MTQIKTLGKYHILERLAGTPLAAIYKVKTVGIAGFEKVQVLKRVMPAYSGDQQFARAFIEEAKIAFSLNHRNIVQVFEFGKIGAELFVATEYIPGVNLGEIVHSAIERQQPLPVGIACYLMGEVAAGLEYGHRKTDQFSQPLDVVHCNLDPANVACSFEGSVKILDFGIARAAEQTVPLADRARGVPRYRSPEQVRGEEPTVRSDIFSFGAILWEILTGVTLFAGDTVDDVNRNILSAPLARPHSVNVETPDALDTVAMRCLERDPRRRFESASELQLELHRIQREVGPVIGARALSSFIREQFPDQSETRDVRQEQVDLPPAAPPALAPPKRDEKLIEAAAELARPHNPPAPVVDSVRSRRRGDQTTARRTVDRKPTATNRRGITTAATGSLDGDIAGVLRAPRELDDDESGRWPEPAARLTPSDSVSVSIPLDRDIDTDVEELSLSAVIDERPIESPSSVSLDLDRARIEGASIELPDARDELDEIDVPIRPRTTQRRRTEVPPAIRERKRFIAVATQLACRDRLRDDAIALASNIAYKLDGLIHHQGEQELVVLFGLPTSHENDIVSAIRFALDANEAIAHLELDATGVDLSPIDAASEATSVRVGIRAGTVRMSTQPSKEGYQVLGRSIDEAQALATHAPAGQIYLAGAAARLAATHYVLRDALPLRRQGKPIRCHRVVGPRTGARRSPTTESDPLVGREIELKSLQSAWREAVTGGRPQALMIVGDPGIGKTRLIDDFLQRFCADARVATATAMPHRAETPYAVILDLLRSLTGVWGTRDSSRIAIRLSTRLRRILAEGTPLEMDADEVLDAVELLLDPRDIPTDNRGHSRARVMRALREIIFRAASAQPLVLAVGDLHWADRTSLDCLRELVAQPSAPCPTLFLFSIRPEEDVHPAMLFDESDMSLMHLNELDDKDRQRLIVDLLGENATDTVVAEIERRAGGNPLFIRELCLAIRELRASGADEIPSTVQGVVAGRVDRLPRDLKTVLQYATVLGPSLREAILGRLLKRNPARQLGELRNRGFLVPATSASVPFASTAGASERFERHWSFRHLIVQEAVYQSLNAVDRRALHRRVGQIMGRRAAKGSSDPLSEIARHLELGGLTREAGHHYLRAANEAAAAYANDEALELYSRAQRLTTDEPELQYAAWAGRERIHGRLGLHDEQAEDLAQLRNLSGNDPRRTANLRTREAMHLLRRGSFFQALAAAEQAEAAAMQANDPLLQGEALRIRGEAYGRLNDHKRAIEAVTRAIAIFAEHGSPHHQLRARIAIGRILLLQARYDEAFHHYDPALELIKQTGDRWQERILRNNLAVVHACRGDFSRALEDATYSFKLCQQFGDRARQGDNASVLGIVHLELGLFDRAREYIDDALAIHRETGSQWSEGDTLVYAGLLENAQRQHALALDQLDRARGIADEIGAKYIGINARNATALTLCDRGGTGDAERARQQATTAFTAAQQIGLVVGEIPALSRAARATAMLGDVEAARALSRRAVELLEDQKNIESAEEEILFTHYRVLDRLGDPQAGEYLERAHSGFVGKMALLDDPAARHAYSENVRLNVAIREHYRAREP